ncbi:uncharacterized protein LOC129752870 [Uranotaenia lowii]|uniref:uncharacterized protein LOC129752870 n=1 Tax=Uranotaenia lowii TaxID=190385 RepID=UPI0024789B37|nr:uncharacterized protein LOC129752870 [Uranotaenia lowii]
MRPSSTPSSTPNQSEEYSCVACQRPDSADNIVACDKCDQWWHYSCAGVTDSIKDRPWTCPKCLPTPATSTTTTSSSRRTRLELSLKHLEEQKEIAEKRINLEDKFLEERFRIIVESLSEDGNRSARSRVNTTEIRERNSDITNWVQSQSKRTVIEPQPPTDPAFPSVSIQPLELETAVGSRIQSSESTINKPEEVRTQTFQSLEQLLQKCRLSSQPNIEDIRELQAQLAKCQNQLDKHSSTFPKSQLAVDPPVPPGTSKGAVPKRDNRPENRPSENLILNDIRTQERTVIEQSIPEYSVQRTGFARNLPLVGKSVFPVGQNGNQPYKLHSRQPEPFALADQVSPPQGGDSNLLANQHTRHYQGHPTDNILPYRPNQNLETENSQLNKYQMNPVPLHSVTEPTCISRPTAAQLAARQSGTRDLPEFSGNPEDWPIFISCYNNSTSMCGYNNSENLLRLQRSLKGHALNAVRYYMLSPDTVAEVINTLQTLYGRPETIINRLIKNVRDAPTPKADRPETLIDFGVTVRNLVQHLVVSGHHAHLSCPLLLQEFVLKLPSCFQYEWGQLLVLNPMADLSTFSNFMSNIIQSASKVVIYTGSQANRHEKNRSRDSNYLHTHIETSVNQMEISCFCCQESGHRVRECKKFKDSTVENRWRCVKESKLCRTCLGLHGRRPCRFPNRCGVDGCTRWHHPLLHSSQTGTESTDQQANIEHHTHHHGGQSLLFRIIPITIHGSSKSLTVFAFLDEGSSATLIEQDLAQELGIEGPTVPLCLKWTADVTRSEEKSQMVALCISEVGKNIRFHIKNVRTVNRLNLPAQTLRFTELEESYDHLKGLPVVSYENETPKVLIGLQHWKLAIPRKLKEGTTGPTACKTQLGWCVFGDVRGSRVSECLNYHLCECSKMEELDELVRNYFNREDCGVTPKEKLESVEDNRARTILEKSTQKIDGRYRTELLWRYDNFELPDSYAMAKARLECLERRMQRNPDLRTNIHRQIEEYQLKGYAHRATQRELDMANPKRIWYLPLGAVTNPKKKGKVRLIWDAAAKVDGVSLNSLLLAGPDLLTPLSSVLFRFRQFPVAVSGDLKEMFHQIEVAEKDRHSQRFLWRNNPDKEPEIFLMDVVTFGAKSSPTTAQYIKNRNAMDFQEQYPRAVEGICQATYVDDYLDSFETSEHGQKVAAEVKMIHSQGGFEIRNWASNDKAILNTLGKSQNSNAKDLASSEHGTERVLGLLWEPAGDFLSFSTHFQKDIATLIAKHSKPTKRQVLKCLMSLFDPLGLLSSYLVHGKVLMQDIWRTGIKWDKYVSDEIFKRWTVWIESLNKLGAIKSLDAIFQMLAKIFIKP